MKLSQTSISGAWLLDHQRHKDERGWFQEWFKRSNIEEQVGFQFQPAQINISSSHQGVIRGIHYSIANKGQGKLVTVMQGEIDDYAVDVRRGSPTFGKWERVRLSSDSGKSVLLQENLAHAFQVISKTALVCYSVTEEFNPDLEKAISPFCPTLRIDWNKNSTISVSKKDEEAPFLDFQEASGLLPLW
jgi:dTDP-4-dehydrorhamnose 3,5-epimerase